MTARVIPIRSFRQRRTRDADRQVRGETLREVTARDGVVEIVTTCPDGAVIRELLTPDEAAEWADDIRDAAADALMRGDGQ